MAIHFSGGGGVLHGIGWLFRIVFNLECVEPG
jgi:hypothetical protein